VSVRARVLALAVVLLVSGCDEIGPLDVTLPAIVFVSGEPLEGELYLWSDDTLTRLTSNEYGDEEPHVAAGHLVFTSNRDGNPEIYFGDVRHCGAEADDAHGYRRGARAASEWRPDRVRQHAQRDAPAVDHGHPWRISRTARHRIGHVVP
jgi:hypothetical protein